MAGRCPPHDQNSPQKSARALPKLPAHPFCKIRAEDMASLLNMTLVRRVQWLGAFCLVVTASMVTNLVKDYGKDHVDARREAAALAPAAAWVQLARVTAEHRGLSAGLLGGNEDFRAKREAKQQEVDAALALALQSLDADVAVQARPLLEGLRQEWASLGGAVANKAITGKDSFRRHNQMVQRQLDVLDEVVAGSGLLQEDEMGMYNLIVATLQRLPQASEWTGQLRGFGAGMLARQAFEPQDKAFIALTLTNTQQAVAAVQSQLQRAARNDESIDRAVKAPLLKTQAAWDEAARTIRQAILEAETPAMAGAAYFAKLTEAIDAQQALAQSALDLLGAERASRVWTTARKLGAVSLLGLLLASTSVLLTVTMVRAIRHSSQAALTIAGALSKGDFSVQQPAHGQDEFAQIVMALDHARLAISRAMEEVRMGVDTIATASEQISQGSSDLSQRTEKQASALQQTAASMEELTGTVSHSSDSARQANQLATAASAAAAEGGDMMNRVVGTMDEIAHSSQKISNIIGVIDGIAFQTNILALNAAVEAARAGEQGRGFAVVASEVRQLAQRSAEAAREIKSMISASSERVDAGGRLVQTAGRSIQEIVSQVRRMSDLIGEIAAASGEQSKGIAQINEAVNHLDHGTQQNSALAEESAAAAESLREQSERLAQAVGQFRLAGT
jgi:methyl-accepting chemotaxis protein